MPDAVAAFFEGSDQGTRPSLPRLGRARGRAGRRSKERPAPADRHDVVAAEPAATPGLPDGVVRTSGHLVATSRALWAVYVLGPQNHANVTLGARREIQHNQADRWAELAGHDIKLLVLPRPWPLALWAREMDRVYGPTRLPDPPEGETWADFLVAGQAHAEQADVSTMTAVLQVRLARFDANKLHVLVDHSREVSEEFRALRKRIAEIDEAVARPGFSASPIEARTLNWLLHATKAPGITPPPIPEWVGDIQAEDAADVAASVVIDAEPYQGHAVVHALRGARPVERAVTVLSLGRIKPREEFGPLPWLAAARSHDVWLCGTFRVMAADELGDQATTVRRKLADNLRHFESHEETPPRELERAYLDARQAEDEITSGSADVATRLVGVMRAAVAATPQTIGSRVEDFIQSQNRINGLEWVPTHAHVAHLREWDLGAPIATAGMRRWLPARLVAAGVPNADTRLGSPMGPPLGYTVGHGGRSLVQWEPTYGPATNRGGLCIVQGSQGGGKSVLGSQIIDNAAWTGARVVVIDPSGPMARLATLPHLRDHTRIVDLLAATRGVLNPYVLVPDPRPEDHPTTAAWETASAEAEHERRSLVADVFGMLLPSAYTKGPDGGRTLLAIQAATFDAPAHYGASPWAVLDAMRRAGGIAGDVARAIGGLTGARGANLIFPTRDDDSGVSAGEQVTIITTPGLRPPDAGTEATTWEEIIAAPVYALASWLAARSMFESTGRKLIFIDEAHIASGMTSMRTFMVRGSRLSRKHNAGLVIASQNPGDFLRLSTEIANLCDSGFIGRLKSSASDNASTSAAETALRVLGLPTDIGLERTISRLAPGQFLVRDWDGRAGVMQSTAPGRPEFWAAAQTTPDSAPLLSIDAVIP